MVQTRLFVRTILGYWAELVWEIVSDVATRGGYCSNIDLTIASTACTTTNNPIRKTWATLGYGCDAEADEQVSRGRPTTTSREPWMKRRRVERGGLSSGWK